MSALLIAMTLAVNVLAQTADVRAMEGPIAGPGPLFVADVEAEQTTTAAAAGYVHERPRRRNRARSTRQCRRRRTASRRRCPLYHLHGHRQYEHAADRTDPTQCLVYGSEAPFSFEKLLGLCQTRDEYVRRVNAQADQVVRDGWLLPEYAAKFRAEAARFDRLPAGR